MPDGAARCKQAGNQRRSGDVDDHSNDLEGNGRWSRGRGWFARRVLGLAVAGQLARTGRVLVHGRDAARGGETVEAITAAGGRRASSLPTSVTPATSAPCR